MKWIKIKDQLPPEDSELLCWSVKFGDEERSGSSHPAILTYSQRTFWDEEGNEYEFNPDYHTITHWSIIEPPKP